MPTTVLAVLLAIIAAFGFSIGASSQHLVVASQGDKWGSVSIFTILSNVRSFPWMFGWFMIAVSTVFHIWALSMAPVTLIQPLGVMAVPFTIATAPFFRGDKPNMREIAAVLVTIVGLIGFTKVAANISGSEEPSRHIILISAIILLVICLALLAYAKRGRSRYQNLAYALGGGFSYGFASGLLKAFLTILQEGKSWSSPIGILLIVTIAGAYLYGAYCVQQAYATGKPEVVLAVLTALDPLVAVLFGFIALGETQGMTTWHAVAMVVLSGVIVWGVAFLSASGQDNLLGYEPDLAPVGAGAT